MATSVENVEEPGIAESLIEAATQIQVVDRQQVSMRPR